MMQFTKFHTHLVQRLDSCMYPVRITKALFDHILLRPVDRNSLPVELFWSVWDLTKTADERVTVLGELQVMTYGP